MANLKRGKYHEALPLLRRATAASPQPDFELHVALGEALLAVNEPEAARAQWQLAEQLAEVGSEAAALARSALATIDARLGAVPPSAVTVSPTPVAVDA